MTPRWIVPVVDERSNRARGLAVGVNVCRGEELVFQRGEATLRDGVDAPMSVKA